MKLSDLENFELVEIEQDALVIQRGLFALKPIAPKEHWIKSDNLPELLEDIQPVAKEGVITLTIAHTNADGQDILLSWKRHNSTEPQATAIKEAVNALMEYIVTGDTDSSHRALIATVNFMADKAREALGGNNV